MGFFFRKGSDELAVLVCDGCQRAHDGRIPTWGGMDEVAVYGAALSSARIQAHYHAGSGK